MAFRRWFVDRKINVLVEILVRRASTSGGSNQNLPEDISIIEHKLKGHDLLRYSDAKLNPTGDRTPIACYCDVGNGKKQRLYTIGARHNDDTWDEPCGTRCWRLHEAESQPGRTSLGTGQGRESWILKEDALCAL